MHQGSSQTHYCDKYAKLQRIIVRIRLRLSFHCDIKQRVYKHSELIRLAKILTTKFQEFVPLSE